MPPVLEWDSVVHGGESNVIVARRLSDTVKHNSRLHLLVDGLEPCKVHRVQQDNRERRVKVWLRALSSGKEKSVIYDLDDEILAISPVIETIRVEGRVGKQAYDKKKLYMDVDDSAVIVENVPTRLSEKLGRMLTSNSGLGKDLFVDVAGWEDSQGYNAVQELRVYTKDRRF